MSFPAKYPTLNETTFSKEAKDILERIIRVAFPHKNIPDAAYRRMRDTIVSEAEGSTWFRVILTQGLISLGSHSEEPFLDLPPDRALAALRRVSDLDFFGFIRRTTVLNLYDDPEVWAALGYEGESFSKGGYLNHGFDDLDWLPAPRIEETDEALPDRGPLAYTVAAPPSREGSGGSAAAKAAGPSADAGTGLEGKPLQGGAQS